jgi:hypothetical protein
VCVCVLCMCMCVYVCALSNVRDYSPFDAVTCSATMLVPFIGRPDQAARKRVVIATYGAGDGTLHITAQSSRVWQADKAADKGD